MAHLGGEVVCRPSQRYAAADTRGAGFCCCCLLQAGVHRHVHTAFTHFTTAERNSLHARARGTVRHLLCACAAVNPSRDTQRTRHKAACTAMLCKPGTEHGPGALRGGRRFRRPVTEHLPAAAQVQGAAEVHQLQMTARVQEKVLRLQVPVHDLATRRTRTGRGLGRPGGGQHEPQRPRQARLAAGVSALPEILISCTRHLGAAWPRHLPCLFLVQNKSDAAPRSGLGGHGALACLLATEVLQHEHHLGRVEAGDIGRQPLPRSDLVVQLTCSVAARRTRNGRRVRSKPHQPSFPERRPACTSIAMQVQLYQDWASQRALSFGVSRVRRARRVL